VNLSFSIIVPVYNRPNEVEELLDSLSKQDYKESFEIVIVEDGSTERSDTIVEKYKKQLKLSYYYKTNSGPGDSRNYGMKKAKGNYFLIFDSDCVIPSQYLSEVAKGLNKYYTACFGGPDNAMASFSPLQKAINYSMTSFLTTGGIRGKSEKLHKFQPRSFNMGISKKAFETTNGFAQIHPGEDPDLTIRLWNANFKTQLLSKAFVYHKRRISWSKFKTQVNKFGQVRPILDKWHPETAKLTYWFPSLFIFGLLLALVLILFKWYIGLLLYSLYYLILFVDSSIKNKSIYIGFLSLLALTIQFYGYGIGFIKSKIKLAFSNKNPELLFPHLFFKK
jgi:glycosyltransferase involved in cell wall biosynthesis